MDRNHEVAMLYPTTRVKIYKINKPAFVTELDDAGDIVKSGPRKAGYYSDSPIIAADTEAEAKAEQAKQKANKGKVKDAAH